MSIIFRQVKSDTEEVPMLDFIKRVEPNQAADKAFQANEFTRWKIEQGSSYMTSTIRNMAPSKFIFCDVEKCLKSAIERESKIDEEYFQKWLDAGVTYLNLDSNNRTINIVGFIDGSFGVEEGTYEIEGNIFKIKTDLNDKLVFDREKNEVDYTKTTLPKAIVSAFLEARVNLEIYTDTTREELSEVFTRINDGKPLNEPEKRNARTSDVANVIRELAEQHKDRFFNSLTKWFTPEQQNRRGLDDFIAGMCHVFFEGAETTISPASLNSMYRIGSEVDQNINLFKKRFNQFMSWVSKGDLNAIPNRNSIFDLWIIFIDLKNDKKEIKPGKEDAFINHYVKVVGDLLRDKTPYPCGKGDPKSFETMVGGRQAANNVKRNQMIMEKLYVDEYFIKMDSKRVVNDSDKLAVAARDNFKTPEGKDIDLSKLQTKEYHKGHVNSYRDTGDTSIDNTVIQTDIDNWKTGTKKVKVSV